MRQAYADDLTDAQLKFIFHAQQERERIKKEQSDTNTGNTSVHNF